MISWSRRGVRIAFLCLAVLVPSIAPAHEGHDHGAEEERPAAPSPSVGMLEASGSSLELAGVLDGDTLVLWIDRIADTGPVTGATVEVAGPDGALVPAQAAADGTFRVPAPWAATPGQYDVTVAVSGEGVADLLVGTLAMPAPDKADAAAIPPWLETAGLLALGIGAGMLVALLARPGPPRAFSVALLLTTLGGTGESHEGHDHGPAPATPAAAAPATAATGTPHRLPDGSLFVPKRTQRLLDLRTTTAGAPAASAGRVLSVTGIVTLDPNAAARVQASQSGRFEAPAQGMPYRGERIEAGRVLGHIVPSVDTVARGEVQERLAEVEKQLVIARRAVQRLSRLSDVVTRRELEDARAELAGLERQRAALDPTLARRETLTAPLAGVVAEVSARPGMVIDDRDETVLFAIVDPSRLLVEALVPDLPVGVLPLTADAVGPDGQTLPLRLLGRAPVRQAGMVPLLFRLPDGAGPEVGQPLRLYLLVPAAGDPVEGILLPRDAVVRGEDGLPRVLEQTGPQTFIPRPVRVQPVDGGSVMVLAGLEPGARVVTRAAGLIAGIR